MAATEHEPLSYEEALQELEAVVRQLEEGNLPLEEAMRLFTRGRELLDYCARLLKEARLRVRFLYPPDALPEDLRAFLDDDPFMEAEDGE